MSNVFASYESNFAGLNSRDTSQTSRMGEFNSALPVESFALSGYLYKKSSSGEWQKRYFELNGNYLCYYKTNKMTKLLAAINIPQVGKIVLSGEVNDSLGNGYVFQMDLKDRQYCLRADSYQEARQWVDTLSFLRDNMSGKVHHNPLSTVYNPSAVEEDAKYSYNSKSEPQAVVQKPHRFNLFSCCVR